MIPWQAVDLWLERPAVEVVMLLIAVYLVVLGLVRRP